MEGYLYILLIALGQGLLLAFFILTSKYYKTKANQWLAVALILLSVMSIIDIAGSQYIPDSALFEFFLHDMELGFLVYIPLYFFFKISTSNSTEQPTSINFYWLLPFVLDTLINLFIVLTYPIEVISTKSEIQLFYEIETILSILVNVTLCYKSYYLIKSYNQNAEGKAWVYKIWQSTVLLLVVWFLITIGGYVVSSSFSTLINTLYITISIWMFWMIYNGIVNLKLIDDRKAISQKLGVKPQKIKEVEDKSESVVITVETKNPPTNNAASNVNLHLFDQHFERLNKLMVLENLYRNEDLSIDDVAHSIGMSAGYISKIIKKSANKNFSIWVNEFRVEEVKNMFEDNDFNHYTTLSIGLEAGFKSKSSFYATFKKITGETPARFRKKKS